MCGNDFVYRDATTEERKAFPFCSERCKYADLDKWFKAEHRISSPIPKESDEERDSRSDPTPPDKEES